MSSSKADKFVFRSDAVIYNPVETGEVASSSGDFLFLRRDNDVITITPLMKEILEHARTPQTEEELATWLSVQQHCPYDKIYPSVNSFLRRMIRFGAVVTEQEATPNGPSTFEEIERTKKIDDFILLDRIGKNSSVAIYKCFRENEPDQLYSIKVLIGDDTLDSFFREAEILKTLPPHPSVRKCYEASVSKSNIPYLLLEYVDGKSISDSEIKKDLPLGIKYKIGGEVMASMHHLHAHDILHGDIHASNFLVDANHHVHLIDLGMAFHANEDAGHGGIPRYMPPERMPDHNYSFSKKRGDFVSEVFQTGICLYLLLSGKYPFNGLLLKDLAHAIKYEAPPPLTETFMHEAIPIEVAGIVLKALEKERPARYASILEMMNEWNAITKNLKNGFPVFQPIYGS